MYAGDELYGDDTTSGLDRYMVREPIRLSATAPDDFDPDDDSEISDEAQVAVSNRLLDVERLARAVYNVWQRTGGFGYGLAVSELGHADIAEDFAAEYVALFDDDWSCIDCGIPLEPGAPPICEECVDG